MRQISTVIATLLVITLLGLVGAGEPVDLRNGPTKIRVGTYDNRSITVAYAASTFNPVREKIAEYEAAKKSGDAEKMKQLEAWGQEHQRVLHFQGFGRVPVSDLLQPVKDQLAGLAAAEHLSAIAMQCDYTAADVEVVDVTDQLVQLFKPTEKTLEMASRVRHAEPISLTVLADLPAEE